MTDIRLIDRYIEHLKPCLLLRQPHGQRAPPDLPELVRVPRRTARPNLGPPFPDDLLAWIAHRESTGVRDSTIARDLCVFRTLHAYLHSSGLVGATRPRHCPSMSAARPRRKEGCAKRLVQSRRSPIGAGGRLRPDAPTR